LKNGKILFKINRKENMKISKIPGLGRFGHYIDDIDLNHIDDSQWEEIGKLHLQGLVTVIRGNALDPVTYYQLMKKWGNPRSSLPLTFYLKYGHSLKHLIAHNLLDDADKHHLKLVRSWRPNKQCPGMIRVTGKKNAQGNPLGVFNDGELLWHSNESADPAFTPGVSLMGYESMTGSCTGFVTTPDWFELQTESFRSELRELITVNNSGLRNIQHGQIENQLKVYRDNNCPEPNAEMPLVIQSPGGIEGLHLTVRSFDYFKGMSKDASAKLFDKIVSGVMDKKYMYEHWYKSDTDLLIFDNSITLHNRKIENDGTAPNRVGLRIQFDYDKLVSEYQPYYQQEFNISRQHRMELISESIKGLYSPL
jgi:alpha-ketoglutarate-dependent taurine dioxygenase